MYFHACISVPGKVSFVIASRVNDSSLNISWGLADPPNGNITHYLVWINSTLDNRAKDIDASSPRTITEHNLLSMSISCVYDLSQFCVWLIDETIYKVCVAAVNENVTGPCEVVEIEIVFHPPQSEQCHNGKVVECTYYYINNIHTH